MEDRLQERWFGQREEKSLTVQGQRTEHNMLFSVQREQMEELAAAAVSALIGFLVDQHLMVPDWAESLRVTTLLSKLFLMCLINIALD